MKKGLKNLFALVIAICMIICMLPITSFAQEDSATEEIGVTQEVEKNDKKEDLDIEVSEENSTKDEVEEPTDSDNVDDKEESLDDESKEELEELDDNEQELEEDIVEEEELEEDIDEEEELEDETVYGIRGTSDSSTEPVRIKETDDYFSTLEDAINKANTMSGVTIEVLDDVVITSDISITSSMTLVSAAGAHSISFFGGHLYVQDGDVTLGDTSYDLLTILGSVTVYKGNIYTNDGISFVSSGSTALVLNGPNVGGVISGGYFKSTNAPLSLEKGAHLTEIISGTFVGNVDAMHLSDKGTRIDVISGGSFYQIDSTTTLHGHAVFVQNNATIGLISGGYFEAIRNCALVVIRAAWIDEISGGTFIGIRKGTLVGLEDTRNSAVRVEGEDSTTGIGIISGGRFSSPNFGVLIIGDSAQARINTISGGLFEGAVALQCDRNSVIDNIVGGLITGNQGMLNAGTINNIGGDVQIKGSSSYGIYNYSNAKINNISGGSISSTDSYGIINAGTITLISGGTFYGSSAVYNNGANAGTLTTISGGVFHGRTGAAISVAKPLNLEPGLSAEKGFGRYWGKDGVVFNREDLIYYPGNYFMSTRTEAVSGITDVEFKYLTLSEAEYEVKFHAKGGYFGDGTTIKTHIVSPPSVTVGDANIPVDLDYYGYTFIGWLDEDGYDFSGSTIINGNKDIYAQWEANAYTVVYDANGGEGYMANQSAAFNSNLTLNANEFSRYGYTFKGWNTESNGTGSSYDNVHTFMPWDLTENLTLYAQWEAKTYTVKFDANGGEGTMDDQSAVYNENLTLIDNKFTMNGHTFLGWNSASDGSGKSYSNNFTFTPWDMTETLTLYAQWEKSVYNISYFANGGTGNSYVETAVLAQNYSIKANSFARGGYTFNGWNTAANGSGTSYAPGTVIVISNNVNLYAQWTAIVIPPVVTFTVTYLPGTHGTFATQTTTGLLFGTATPNSPTVTGQLGWIFNGWSPVIASTVIDNVTYTAMWREAEIQVEVFSVVFVDFNGDILKSDSVEYGQSAVAPDDPSRDGYEFTGWDKTFNYITSDLTVTAQYKEIEETKEDKEVVIPELVDTVDPPKPDELVKETRTELPIVITNEEALAIIMEEGIPSITIGGLQIPLIAGAKMREHIWALMNLIMALVGVILAAVLLVKSIFKKRQKDDTYYDYNNEDDTNIKKRRVIISIVTIALGIVGLIVFLLTEDMTKLMVLLDRWTIVNGIILLLEIIGSVIAFRGKKKEKDESTVNPPWVKVPVK